MKKTVDVTLSSYEDVLRIKQSRMIITSKRWKNIFDGSQNVSKISQELGK